MFTACRHTRPCFIPNADPAQPKR